MNKRYRKIVREKAGLRMNVSTTQLATVTVLLTAVMQIRLCCQDQDQDYTVCPRGASRPRFWSRDYIIDWLSVPLRRKL